MQPDMISLMQQLVTAVQSIALSVDVMSMDLRALNKNVSQLVRKEIHRAMSPLTLAAECSYSQDDEASPRVAPPTPLQQMTGADGRTSHQSADFPEEEAGSHEKFDSIRDTLREDIKRAMNRPSGVDSTGPLTPRESSSWEPHGGTMISGENMPKCSDSKETPGNPVPENRLEGTLNPSDRFPSPAKGVGFGSPGTASFPPTPLNPSEGRFPNSPLNPEVRFSNPDRGSGFTPPISEKGVAVNPRYPLPEKGFMSIPADTRYPNAPKPAVGLPPPDGRFLNPAIHKKGGAFKCVWCDREFSDSYKLRRHWRVHTGEKPFPCFQCGKSFAHKENLIVHGRIHSGERPYRCDVCGKAFAQKGRLTIHGRVHTGERPYSCDVCGKAYKDSWKLKTHRRQHERQF